MSIKTFFQKIETLLRTFIINFFTEPNLKFLPYVPYQRDKKSYLVTKIPLDTSEKDESGISIPPQYLWAGYGDTKEEYLQLGKDHFNKMLEILGNSGYSVKEGDRILDFGCATGRILRNFEKLSNKLELWGCDINAEAITWCKYHLSPSTRFFTSTTMPHLPIEDRYYDLIYASSIFTHIDDLADAWFLELRRVLRPGGKLYITIHDENLIDLFAGELSGQWFARYLYSNKDYKNYIKADYGMFTIGRSNKSKVFYNSEYLIQRLQPFYKALSVTKQSAGLQTGVLLERI